MSELRTEVDTWVRENRPKTMDVGSAPAWFTTLGERGYTVAHWPREHGGLGYTEEQSAVVRSVLTEHGVGLPDYYFVPLTLIGPAIMAWGTAEQQQRYLPGIVRGADMWCQLFSEPGAGSDLASLATRAVPEGTGWRVNGQKVWSSFAAESRYGMLLARTDPDKPKNAGITCFLVDMTAPGVTVRPLRQLTGEEHFCEVFLQDVLLGPESVLGPVDDGWRVAMSTLNAERSGLSETTSASGVPLGPMLDRARRSGKWTDPVIRDRMADLIAVERALTLTNQRASGGSITKLVLSELSQQIAELGFELGGAEAAHWADTVPPDTHDLLDSRRFTIAGGTSEVQRNIVGEKVLGLDREIDPGRGKPWRELRRS
ncbi:acyl-CoA dehydrogenase family protein [Mycolicibacterium diernhoferi]|uniref:Acyl-CoA dehydrogenase n=1 Tax=Mycolicibacterium diernhoferi TaxID=1801 RepID=A0A1Q4HEZ1_9MYCO|nr:acyl-CoA dehydrogenase family protein [Mycolicibacterium diernhoferi]OJZ66088.1 acyl-CoA dehydrogenase [Mycolicibacterium diernhoferi]OPE55362.1 acyl-CoA dehydrogenase [Mycolicibacterium diernhoferi]PEG54551.1 acyl-CoA dehydrogenase [Mycolicibacterium diernhoferi]QYL23998.1 acyl-CoA dehydrogenase family protein [Mycolicibacterium diernhoferi]